MNEKYIEFIPLGAPIPHLDSTMYIRYDEPATLRSSFAELEKDSGLQHLITGCGNVESAFAEFRKMFELVEAAGGLVENEKGEYLLIFRRGKWDLPKGKVDKGETVQEAALREVQEECGISGLSISGELTPTWHIYTEKGRRILKRTHWFRMKCTDTRPLVPQAEEDITEAKWMKKEEVLRVFSSSYGSIRELIGTAFSV